MRFASLIAAVLLGLISVGHILRLIFCLQVVAGGVTIPHWVSIPGFIIPGAIALLLVRQERRAKRGQAGAAEERQ